METLDVLITAKAKIDSPEKWTHEVGARDGEGFPINPTSPRARRFCAYGAVAAATEISDSRSAANEALRDSAVVLFGTSAVSIVNDNPTITHPDIMRLFDGAIDLVRKRETPV
jgi:hypothetical protein